VAAAVTVLFNSPIAGALFALEVIFKRLHATAIITIGLSVLTAWGFNYLMDAEPLFIIHVDHWNLYAIPYFLLLGILAGINSAYLTKSVLFFKSRFLKINKNYNQNFTTIKDFSWANHLPFYVPTEGLVEKGGTASISSSFNDIGGAAAKAARDILNGNHVKGIVYSEKVGIAVNVSVAKSNNLILSPAFLQKIDKSYP
jgi:hypothetical protein